MPIQIQRLPDSADPGGFPTWPLLAMLATQTLATMAAYSFPAVAPVIAADLGVEPALVGIFIAMVYGVGILSALFSPAFIHRYGAVRVSQLVLVATLAMLAASALGSVASVALGAALLGLAYGATAPASTHLLVPRTPPARVNLVLSLRQIGVPLGGVLASLTMAPVTLLIGWRAALLLQMVPALLLVLAMQMSRAQWDSSRDPGRPLFRAATLAPLRMLGESRAIRRLAFMSFVYSGLQLCFVSFMAVHLTSRAGFDLVLAGQALAAYQISGAVSRPIWGWLADNALSARALLVLQGLVMGAASVLAGQFADTWSALAILTVCSVAGATASGYTGIAYGEWARLGGTRRTEATGLGASLMFTGVMVLPTLFSLVVATTGNYALPYAVAGVLAAVAGLSLALGRHGVP